MKLNKFDVGAGIMLIGSMVLKTISREKKMDEMRAENKQILAQNAYKGGYKYQEMLEKKKQKETEQEKSE